MPDDPTPLTHSSGRAMCPYCQEVAHIDPRKIQAHMKTCRKRPKPSLNEITESERLADILWRAEDLSKQLGERATLYRLMNVPEIADEFDRLKRVKVRPIINLARGED